MDGIFVCLELLRFQPQRGHAEICTAAVQDTNNHLFAKLGGQRTYPKVNFVPFRERQFDPPILGNAPFGDIQM